MLNFYRSNALMGILQKINIRGAARSSVGDVAGSDTPVPATGKSNSINIGAKPLRYDNEAATARALRLAKAIFLISPTRTAVIQQAPPMSPPRTTQKSAAVGGGGGAGAAADGGDSDQASSAQDFDDDAMSMHSRGAGIGLMSVLDEIRIFRFLSSSLGTTMTLILFLFPYLCTTIGFLATDPLVAAGCTACFLGQTGQTFLVVGAAFALLGLFFSVYVNRGLSDGFGVVHEVKMVSLLGGTMGLIGVILDTNLDLYEGSNWAWDILTELGILIMCVQQSWLQVGIAIRDDMTSRRGSSQEQAEESSLVIFDRVLDVNSALHSAFEEHLTSEHASESLRFWKEATRWRQSYFEMGPKLGRVRAKKIVSVFIGPDALFPVNISGVESDVLLATVMMKNDATDVPLPIETFDASIAQVKDLMWKDSFIRFRHTRAYREAMQTDREKRITAGGE
jgi:hypothetical protein